MARGTLVVCLAGLLALPAVAGATGFTKPVYVSEGASYQAGEPSIRVDRTDAHQRIWIAAPSGIGVNTRSLPADSESGDLFWSSDTNGTSWKFVTGPAGVGSPTMLGGGDSDVATGYAGQVYGTGLTLANITLAASCDNGDTFSFNPITVLSSPDDRQWIDTYQDDPAPFSAPQLVLTYGNFAASTIFFNQIASPGCAPPAGSANLDISGPDCFIDATKCYQWPGNVAIDEQTGDAYVTYNTQGDPNHDDVMVARVDGGGSRPATQADVHLVTAASDRPDTFDSFTVVAVDRSSNVYVVWSERHAKLKETWTMLAVSKDRGMTWSKPIKVNKSPSTTTYPWIVAGDAGRIDVVYYGTGTRGPSPETVPGSSKWRVYMAQSLDALDPKPAFTESPASPVIQQGSICTSGTGCAPGTRDLLDFFQIDVDAQGLANIAYTDNNNTPPDPSSGDPHQEWITFVQQASGSGLFGS